MLALCCAAMTQAQQYAMIDMEYIMQKIPAYSKAEKTLKSDGERYKKQVDLSLDKVKSLYESYQKQAAGLSESQRKLKEEEVLKAEKEASELKRCYFGPEGEMAKKREQLIKPLQDAVYKAVKSISLEHGIDLVIDRASSPGVIFANPQIDISDLVLQQMGYSD